MFILKLSPSRDYIYARYKKVACVSRSELCGLRDLQQSCVSKVNYRFLFLSVSSVCAHRACVLKISCLRSYNIYATPDCVVRQYYYILLYIRARGTMKYNVHPTCAARYFAQ